MGERPTAPEIAALMADLLHVMFPDVRRVSHVTGLVPVADLARRVAKRGRPYVHVEFGDCAVHYISFDDRAYSILFVWGPEDTGLVEASARLALQQPGLSLGRLYSTVYDEVQNTTDLALYTGINPEHRPTRFVWDASFDRYEVDTSLNPGRRIMTDDHVEFVGHVMLLGEIFLTTQPERAACLLKAFDGERVGRGVRVTVQAEPFTEDVGVQQIRQDCLRRRLFGEQGSGPSDDGDQQKGQGLGT